MSGQDLSQELATKPVGNSSANELRVLCKYLVCLQPFQVIISQTHGHSDFIIQHFWEEVHEALE